MKAGGGGGGGMKARMWDMSTSTLMASQSQQTNCFISSQYVVEWPINGSKAVQTYLRYTLSYFHPSFFLDCSTNQRFTR